MQLSDADSALIEGAAFLESLLEFGDSHMGAAADIVQITAVEFDLPFEIDIEVPEAPENGLARIRWGPPTQWIETSFMPAFHRVRLRAARGMAETEEPFAQSSEPKQGSG